MAIIAAAICVPIVVLMHKALMPTASELKQIDALVLKTVRSQRGQCIVERLSSPDREETDGETKQGYFTYLVHCSGSEYKVRAEWKISSGHIELTSVKPEDY